MDTASEPGSWAAALPFCTQIVVKEFDPVAYEIDHNLRARRDNRKSEPNPYKRGHETRRINAKAQVR